MKSKTDHRPQTTDSKRWPKSKLALFISAFLLPLFTLAQNDSVKAQSVDMATTMRSNGKIYVVVAVLVIILAGIFFYLIRLDRKISRLETSNKND